MNSSLNEIIKKQLTKQIRTADNITPNSITDNLCFFGNLGFINIVLNEEEFNNSLNLNQLNTIRLYGLLNRVIANLFKKHRNFMTLRNNGNQIVGFFNLKEELDYNLIFELATMINSYRKEWLEGLDESKQATFSFSIEVGFRNNGYILSSNNPTAKLFKKEEKILEDYLYYVTPQLNSDYLETKNNSFLVDETIVINLKDNYRKMCLLSENNLYKYESEARATFTSNFQWEK